MVDFSAIEVAGYQMAKELLKVSNLGHKWALSLCDKVGKCLIGGIQIISNKRCKQFVDLVSSVAMLRQGNQ